MLFQFKFLDYVLVCQSVVELFGLTSHTNAFVMCSMQKRTSGTGTHSKAEQTESGQESVLMVLDKRKGGKVQRGATKRI